jgi:hypothetical protein
VIDISKINSILKTLAELMGCTGAGASSLISASDVYVNQIHSGAFQWPEVRGFNSLPPHKYSLF